MSRGEFLGVGAAAAALGTMGVPMGETCAPSVATAAPNPAQCTPGSCEWWNRDPTWCIPAGILNSLWSDFFPRLVAISWHDAMSPPPATRYLGGTLIRPLQRGTTSTGLVDLLIWLGFKMHTDPHFLGAPSSLKYRLKQVIGFFCRHYEATHEPFPMFVAAQGGYDLLLSDQGIELFMPDPPHDKAGLLQFYAFRQTGRPSLGIPSYMTPKALSLISIDAPTGPSQIEADWTAAWILALDPRCQKSPQLLERWGITQEQWDRIRARAQQWLRTDPQLPPASDFLTPGEEPDWGGLASSIEREPRPGEVVPTWLEIFGTDVRPPATTLRVNFDEFVCAMRANRCWEVEGAVYRGFATELPRIVATAWMEPTGGSGPRPYSTAFNDASENGLRRLFRERLETMLPRVDQMAFQASDSRLPDPNNPPSYLRVPPVNLHPPNDGRWNPGDLMITDQGFYFPELGQAPDLGPMLKEIAEGRAGNPVFTDSRRPDGEE
jgi:hypothetical protein